MMEQEEILREQAEENLLQEASRRRFLYADVEELIETGFLTQVVQLDTCTVTFRTFLPADLTRVRSRAKSKTQGIAAWTVASAVWMIDGLEIQPSSLAEEGNTAWLIYQEWSSKLPTPWLNYFSSIVLGLRNRLSRAVRMTEAYCYEPYSRGQWRLLGRPTAGLENASVSRRLWVAHNLAEDQLQEDNRRWVHTRALVSASTSKGGKQLGQALQSSEQRESDRRRKVIEESVNWIIQGEKADQKPLIVKVGGKEIEVKKIYSPTTTEELEEEMRKVFSGEKDFHDMLVDDHLRKIRKVTEERRAEARAKIEEARRKIDERLEMGDEIPAIQGYTREQLDQLKPGFLSPRTTTQMAEAAQGAYVYERYEAQEIRPGVLTPDLRVVDPDRTRDRFAMPRNEDGEPEPPRPGRGPLQAEIEKRKPKI